MNISSSSTPWPTSVMFIFMLTFLKIYISPLNQATMYWEQNSNLFSFGILETLFLCLNCLAFAFLLYASIFIKTTFFSDCVTLCSHSWLHVKKNPKEALWLVVSDVSFTVSLKFRHEWHVDLWSIIVLGHSRAFLLERGLPLTEEECSDRLIDTWPLARLKYSIPSQA